MAGRGSFPLILAALIPEPTRERFIILNHPTRRRGIDPSSATGGAVRW
jgi:hypothetical protein